MAYIGDSSEIGRKGEDIACKFLEGKGHKILNRNFRIRFGEIDIVTEMAKVVHFVEVKTTTRRQGDDMHQRPEENVNESKKRKFSRAVQSYLAKAYGDEMPEWVFLVVAITLDVKSKKAFVKVIEEVLE